MGEGGGDREVGKGERPERWGGGGSRELRGGDGVEEMVLKRGRGKGNRRGMDR